VVSAAGCVVSVSRAKVVLKVGGDDAGNDGVGKFEGVGVRVCATVCVNRPTLVEVGLEDCDVGRAAVCVDEAPSADTVLDFWSEDSEIEVTGKLEVVGEAFCGALWEVCACLAGLVLEDCADVSIVELRSPSRDVLPDPIPTAGTFPTCFEFVGTAAEAWAREVPLFVRSVFDGEVELLVPDVAEDAAAAAWAVEVASLGETLLDDGGKLADCDVVGPADRIELSKGRRDVFPAPIPTAGTFPSSLPFEVVVAVGACEIVVELLGSPVALGRKRWYEIDSERAIKRFGASFVLRTTSKFLVLVNTLRSQR
jgi:hypothetical protein